MKALRLFVCIVMIFALCMSMTVTSFAADDNSTNSTSNLTPSFSKVVNPVVDLLNSLLKPLLAIVIAVGSLYCVILGIKYAKAEEPQDREKAKQHLKNAVIGFVIIFILILALNVLSEPLITWVNANAGKTVIS